MTELLRRVPGVRVLSVGRRPLGVAGERLFPLASLGEAEAARLFADRAAQQGVARGDDRTVREECRRLDGIPPAIEPAGRCSPARSTWRPRSRCAAAADCAPTTSSTC
ncbi:hypothetical protein GCM10010254_45170 [Streptomyces chromofuscus]|nr:hypothetical protein GCM10010254_45170 [Streptomyces chromofuscus]